MNTLKFNLTFFLVLLSSLSFSQSINQYHRTDISDLTSSANINQPLSTFDYLNPDGVPIGWYNAYVSTHRNYLHSFILHKHRTDNWYLGWMEENRRDPVWVKIYHSGNDENLAKLHIENIFQKNIKVNATIYANEINVTSTNWADFVFEEDYQLRSISEVESFIQENNHLPDIPSEQEVKENGISVGEMNAKLLQKIEELTLYVIDLKKTVDSQNERINELEN